jgi:uncharacterized membrane protein YphA (DoxX/SURF4 family)
MISQRRLKDVERVVRLTMILILVTAGASKFFSQGGFFDYYSQLFQGDLRIQLPPVLVNIFLSAVPYVEVLLGMGLLLNQIRSRVIYAWFVFMWSLLFGHYILQEWSAVNQMLDYVFLGVLCFVLPHHSSWFRRDVEVSS